MVLRPSSPSEELADAVVGVCGTGVPAGPELADVDTDADDDAVTLLVAVLVAVAVLVSVAVAVRVVVWVTGGDAADDGYSADVADVAEAVGAGVESAVRVRSGEAVGTRVGLPLRLGGVSDRDPVAPGRELEEPSGRPPSPPPHALRARAGSSSTAKAGTAVVHDRAGPACTCPKIVMAEGSRGAARMTSPDPDEADDRRDQDRRMPAMDLPVRGG